MVEPTQTPKSATSAFALLEEVLQDPQSHVFALGTKGPFVHRQAERMTTGTLNVLDTLSKSDITLFPDGYQMRVDWSGRFEGELYALRNTHNYFELYLPATQMFAEYARPKSQPLGERTPSLAEYLRKQGE